MGKQKDMSFSDFYCVECGSKGLSLPRPANKQREAGHLKSLWCETCQKQTNHAEIKEKGSAYTLQDFLLEFELGRFVDGQRIETSDLIGCSYVDCEYNIGKKCWNANQTYKCLHRGGK